ncbi:MAG TPA: hypothetical protein VLN45_01655 [Ignavibacteriaceae bacterium]|nr:hypothetical protein [Ignavibacteriaceae bacterium]
MNFLFEYEYIPKIFHINKDAHIKRRELEPVIFSDKDRKKIVDELDKEKKNLNFKLLVSF